MTATPSLRQRTLSKSDFKLASSCEAKLYFRKNGYPDNRDANPQLDSDPELKAGWRQLLLRYCALDTLSMVLIFGHLRRALAAH